MHPVAWGRMQEAKATKVADALMKHKDPLVSLCQDLFSCIKHLLPDDQEHPLASVRNFLLQRQTMEHGSIWDLEDKLLVPGRSRPENELVLQQRLTQALEVC